MTMLGTIAGAVITGVLMQHGYRFESYLVIVAVITVTLALTVWKVREEKPTAAGPLRIATFLRDLWINPSKHPDFAWLFVSRLVVLMGFYTVYNFAQFFLKDFMRIERFLEATGTLHAVVVAGALASALAGGWLSDRTGRRGIVSGAGVLMAAAMLLFLVSPTFELLLILGVVFGLGYGAFVSVDWALATDVLPSQAAAAKLLGIWGIAATLPQVLAPLVGGPLLDAFNRQEPNFGYIVLLAVGAWYLVLGSALVWRIRGVR
jgi:MFS family permease